MPIYDRLCVACGNTFEAVEPMDDADDIVCPICEVGMARRIISAGRCFTGNNDAEWVRSVTDVVAKGSDADAHDRRFLASNKTKQDLKRWMTAKGLRHLETGEPLKPKQPDMSRAAEKILRMRQERRRIEIRTK
jgi:putative FmdB family regulatory protein